MRYAGYDICIKTYESLTVIHALRWAFDIDIDYYTDKII